MGKKFAALTLYPTLALTPFGAENFPHNGANPSIPCPLPPGNGGRDATHAVAAATQKLASLPRQTIKSGHTGTFVWAQSAHEGVPHLSLSFSKRSVPRPGKTPQFADQRPWGETFTGQTLAQVDFPLLGYNPLNLDLYSKEGVSTSGTTPVTEGQTLSGTPVFAYPAQDSYDYVKSTLAHSPNLPWGTRPETYVTSDDSTHAEMLSSVADRMRSWSLTLGLSAGIDKLVSASTKGSYQSKIEEQTKTESRYSVSRKIGTTHRIFTDVPRLDLHEEYKAAIFDRLDELVKGKRPKWDPFINKFGTHYSHAITSGYLELLETHYSSNAEYVSRNTKFSLTDSAKATLENLIEAGGKIGVDFQWGEKLGGTVGQKDVRHIGVGSKDSPVAIFFDLRPASELLSPLFFRPPLTPDGNYDHGPDALFEGTKAPFVWYQLRSSFEAYLTDLGLNQPLEEFFNQDYTPRIVKVSITKFGINTPSGDPPEIYGDVSLPAINGAVLLDHQDLHIDYNDAKKFALGENLPGFDTLRCTVAASPGKVEGGAGFRISSTLKDYRVFKADDDLSFTYDVPLKSITNNPARNVLLGNGVANANYQFEEMLPLEPKDK